jgi:hypothetical protein
VTRERRRLCRARTRSATSRRSGTTRSAAADGVAARSSATRSAIVTSDSCPTALTTGRLDASSARATTSSLNAHRSSVEPPPRPTINRSGRWASSAGRSLKAATASATARGASRPCTFTGHSTTSAGGNRRARPDWMSWIAAPWPDVTTPMVSGNAGSACLRSGAKSPSACSFCLSSSNAFCWAPLPACRIACA